MKTAQANKTLIAAAGGSVVLVAAAYVGLSQYAASVAEERIVSTLNGYGLPASSYHWDSISSSPLGGTVTLEGLALNHDSSEGRGRRFVNLHVERLVLNGFNGDSEIPQQASLRLEGVEIPSLAQDGSERNELYRSLASSPLMELARASGRRALAPFDLALAWDIDEQSIDLDWSTLQPELIEASAQQTISGPTNQLQAFITLSQSQLQSPFALMGGLFELGQKFGIQALQVEVKDLGAIARSNLLQSRYDLAQGRIKDLDESTAQRLPELQRGCETELQAVFVNADACEKLAEFMLAERSSVQFSAAGNTPLTFAELVQLNPRSVGFLKQKFSPRID